MSKIKNKIRIESKDPIDLIEPEILKDQSDDDTIDVTYKHDDPARLAVQSKWIDKPSHDIDRTKIIVIKKQKFADGLIDKEKELQNGRITNEN